MYRNFIFTALALLFAAGVFPQAISLSDEMAIDPKIRTGRLDNGLTYYLRHNTRPEKRLYLRLVLNAGSVLEDNNQQGLAHFIEHMAFNGTEHFEKNELVSYLQSLGIRFGPDLNAYTSFDETVYMLTVPSDSARLVKVGMQVLEDWAHNLSLDNREIDKERGGIIEEWRLGQSAQMRVLNKSLPVIFKDSKYAQRLPIGKKEIIENFEYETLKKFYRDWYRPDLMAFIAVGDYDMDVMENMVKEYFGRLKSPEHPRERKMFGIPDNPAPLVSVVSDPEASNTQLILLNKTDVEEEKTWNDYRRNITYRLFTGMINQRLNELLELEDPPFLYAGTQYGSFVSRTKNAYQIFAVVNDSGVERGLRTLLEENERAGRYGFAPGELERQKQNLLSMYERYYNEQDKTESSTLVDEYTRNFLEKEPLPGIEMEYEFVKQYLDGITLEEVNAISDRWTGDENRVIILWAPEKKGLTLPPGDRLLSIARDVKHSDLTPYVDAVTVSELLDELPEPGSITGEEYRKGLELTEMQLSNGVKVILKPTHFKNDEIVITAHSPGGRYLYPIADQFSARVAATVIQKSGIGDYSKFDLMKVLSGKQAFAEPYIGGYEEGFHGGCAPKDMKTMFELIHAYFAVPRQDLTAFKSYIAREKSMVRNQMADPVNYFFDRYRRIVAQDHPHGNYSMMPEDLDKVDFERVYNIYRDRFADAGDFTFIIVGAFSLDSVRPLLTQYLASLPTTGRNESWSDPGIRPPQGLVEEEVHRGVDPKSFVAIYMETPKPFGELPAYRFKSLSEILDRKYTEVLREEMSGVYSIGTMASSGTIPYDRYTLQVIIPCAPDNVDSLTLAAFNEIRKIRQNGVTKEDLQKTKEIQRREKEEQMKSNTYWMNTLKLCYVRDDFKPLTDYLEWIESLSSRNLRKTARKYIDPDHYIKVVLYPEQATGKVLP